MKTALYGVMLGALLAAGCIPKVPFTWPDDGATSDQAALPRKHPAAVRADQVTAENARDKAKELEDELENDRETPK
jgi:hypothetical protein